MKRDEGLTQELSVRAMRYTVWVTARTFPNHLIPFDLAILIYWSGVSANFGRPSRRRARRGSEVSDMGAPTGLQSKDHKSSSLDEMIYRRCTQIRLVDNSRYAVSEQRAGQSAEPSETSAARRGACADHGLTLGARSVHHQPDCLH
jgi:hypothetical protein